MNDPEAGKILLTFLARNSVAPELRQRALETIANHLDGEWSALSDDQQFVTALQAALADKGLQESALQVVESHHLQSVDEDVLRLAADVAVQDALRCAAIKTTVQLAQVGYQG